MEPREALGVLLTVCACVMLICACVIALTAGQVAGVGLIVLFAGVCLILIDVDTGDDDGA